MPRPYIKKPGSREYACVRCGAIGECLPTAHFKYCDICRKAVIREQNKKSNKNRKKVARETRICEVCGKEFSAPKNLRKYTCSTECSIVRKARMSTELNRRSENNLKMKKERSPARTNCIRYDQCLDDAVKNGRKDITCIVCNNFKPKSKEYPYSLMPCALVGQGVWGL